MDRLIKTLPAILKATAPSSEVAAAASFVAWRQAVGEALSAHAVPVKLADEVLVVAVGDEIWQKQLEQMRSQLLFRVNNLLGHSLVKAIEFRIDPKCLALPAALPKPRLRNQSEVPFELRSVAAEIQDADLRRVFLGAATSCLKRQEKQ